MVRRHFFTRMSWRCFIICTIAASSPERTNLGLQPDRVIASVHRLNSQFTPKSDQRTCYRARQFLRVPGRSRSSAVRKMYTVATMSAAPPSTFSIIDLLLMLAVFSISSAVFYFLSRRWTIDRRQAALEDWADEHQFRLARHPKTELPPALQSLSTLNTQVEVTLTHDQLILLRIATNPNPPELPKRWNLLIRQSNIARTPAGLRPIGHPSSFLDLFSLTDYPSMSSERFIVCAADSRAAREMAKSHTRGLIPADIGLILHGQFITLDFSNRPFDTIEFERMLVVMEQVMAHLPAEI
jgi:hypothetical protein